MNLAPEQYVHANAPASFRIPQTKDNILEYRVFDNIQRNYSVSQSDHPKYLSRSFYDPLELNTVIKNCQTCGKIIWEQLVLDNITKGHTLFDIMNELGYVRICCRKQIMGDILINKRLLEQEKNNNIITKLQNGGITAGYTNISDIQAFSLSGFIEEKQDRELLVKEMDKFDLYTVNQGDEPLFDD
jgi:DNA-directed RNA polymerase subunit N (RpoN/RPB10)